MLAVISTGRPELSSPALADPPERGRRSTVRRAAGLSLPLALMDPEPSPPA